MFVHLTEGQKRKRKATHISLGGDSRFLFSLDVTVLLSGI